MGKRAAAAKPKAQSASSNKKSKICGPPPAAAPSTWGRPERPASEEILANPLRFFLVDIEDGPAGSDGLELRLYGLTSEGVSVCARLHGVRPYFYVRSSPEVAGNEDHVRTALEAALPGNLRGTEQGSSAVIRVERVRRTPVLVFQEEDEFLKIIVAGPRLLLPCVRALESGINVSCQEGRTFQLQSDSTFEANISHVLRFLVDTELGGGRWLELPIGCFQLSPDNDHGTTAQIEAIVDLEKATIDNPFVRAIPLDTEIGSSIPPLRTLAFEVLSDSDGNLNAAACVLMVQGVKSPHAKAVWFRQERSHVEDSASGDDWASIKVEEYNPLQEEAPKLFIHEDDATLVEHIGRTFALLDADILLTYDLGRSFRCLLDKKGVAKAGSAIAQGVCRRCASEVKLTQKSNEVSGLVGRLGFDLQKQVEKDHRLMDYSLGSLSEHFCQVALPELNDATLAKLKVERPRVYAQHALRQAEACHRVFDHLAYLYNFVEMARVTGCPLSYLLERGQAIKVQTQLLQEARRRGFVLPSQRPGTGEETTFEGATVLEPSAGFYRSPVAVLDFASLYPSIMMAHNICYSTMLGAGRERLSDAPKHCRAPARNDGEDEPGQTVCFVDSSVRKGLLPSILEHLIAARKIAKKQLAACGPEEDTKRKVLNGRQLAIKLSANSVYGFTGALNGPLPCLEVARSVTAYGREMIQGTKKLIEDHFVQSKGYAYDAKVLYGDTDSVMVRFGSDDLTMEDAMKLSKEAASLCSAAFPDPVHLEFEKVYRPYLLMAKKRYAGLAWSSCDSTPSLETKGIETVRRDWSDLVRQGLEQTLQLLMRPDNTDGKEHAVAYVKTLCEDLRQNTTDFRSLVISKSLGREEYAAKTPHTELAEKLKKRDPSTAPRVGDRISYLVLAGAAKAKVYERVEDPIYALEHDMPIDAEYYLENQLKQPLIRVFEHVCGSVEKAEQALFTTEAGQKIVGVVATMGGMGKFFKAKPKCVACNKVSAKSESAPFCADCEAKGPSHAEEAKRICISKATSLRSELAGLRSHCDKWCEMVPGNFPDLPIDSTGISGTADSRESCPNVNCQVIFKRVRTAKALKTASNALERLKVTDW
mmetsp:Transcript_121587/g.189883  ORF Transcript_121587/g.189883 Transcript_121587/m.189883 type:complete len:1100 (-) Transcript_121587:165-3464(-)